MDLILRINCCLVLDMTLCLSYTITDTVGKADFTLLPTSENTNAVSQSFIPLSSNFYQEPFKGYIIWTTTVLSSSLKYDQGTITVTDGEGNNIGTITFTNLYQDSAIDPTDPAKTEKKSLSYPIQTATGIFSSYIGGSVVVDYAAPKRQIWLFKN
jgi:hypothetical protein